MRYMLLRITAGDFRMGATGHNSLRFCANFKKLTRNMSNCMRECSVCLFGNGVVVFSCMITVGKGMSVIIVLTPVCLVMQCHWV